MKNEKHAMQNRLMNAAAAAIFRFAFFIACFAFFIRSPRDLLQREPSERASVPSVPPW
jgi:hypothetical protein